MVNRKVMIIHLTVGLIKKIPLHKMSYFPEPDTLSKNKIKVELNLSYYIVKSDLKMQQVPRNKNLLKRVI